MKIQESAENYLEAILMISKEKGNCRSIDIENELGFSKPSVSVAMKNLRESRLIKIDGSGNISLLPDGLKIAQAIYERHTILSNMLIELGVPEKIAVADACKIEHDLSNESFEAIKKAHKKFIK